MSQANLLRLSQLHPGQRLRIVKLEIQGTLRRRLLDLGFVQDEIVEVLYKSPLGDPVAYQVQNTTIALRREESSLIYGEIVGGD